MKVVTEILQDLEILKRLLKHNANLRIRINYYLTIAVESKVSVYIRVVNKRAGLSLSEHSIE